MEQRRAAAWDSLNCSKAGLIVGFLCVFGRIICNVTRSVGRSSGYCPPEVHLKPIISRCKPFGTNRASTTWDSVACRTARRSESVDAVSFLFEKCNVPFQTVAEISF